MTYEGGAAHSLIKKTMTNTEHEQTTTESDSPDEHGATNTCPDTDKQVNRGQDDISQVSADGLRSRAADSTHLKESALEAHNLPIELPSAVDIKKVRTEM